MLGWNFARALQVLSRAVHVSTTNLTNRVYDRSLLRLQQRGTFVLVLQVFCISNRVESGVLGCLLVISCGINKCCCWAALTGSPVVNMKIFQTIDHTVSFNLQLMFLLSLNSSLFGNKKDQDLTIIKPLQVLPGQLSRQAGTPLNRGVFLTNQCFSF